MSKYESGVNGYRISKTLKIIQERSKLQAQDLHLVGAQFERLDRLLTQSQNISPQLATLYGRLSQMIHRHADYDHFVSTVLNNELASWVKYTRS